MDEIEGGHPCWPTQEGLRSPQPRYLLLPPSAHGGTHLLPHLCTYSHKETVSPAHKKLVPRLGWGKTGPRSS